MIKKLSITKKVFFLTAVMFCLYLVLTFIVQIFFYGETYIYYKRRELIHQVESLAQKYPYMTSSDEINEALVDFSNNSDSYVLIMNERGNIIYTVSYEMSLVTDSGESIRVTLDNALHDKRFSELNLKIGDKITMDYYELPSQEDNTVFIPVLISNGVDVWQMNGNLQPKNRQNFTPPLNSNSSETHFLPEQRFYDHIDSILKAFEDFKVFDKDNVSIRRRITGTISSITMPDERNLQNSLKRSESALAAIQWIAQIVNGEDLDLGERIHYIYQSQNSASKYIVVVKKIEAAGKPQMIFAVNTLKPVDEAVNVMRESYVIWFSIALLAVIAMSVIFSKLITRSIVNITQVTTKMKNLDFSQKCLVQSDDELGRLAANINDMSEKLDMTIRELVESNKKLTIDIEHERKAELARREFVAAVSHELKTPLAIIRAYSEGIADGATGERRDKYLNVIIEETKKMDSLVLDMLENSKLESGAYKLKIKTYDIAKMVEKITARLKNATGDKSLNFILEKPSDAVNADFDFDMLEQVMNNFIGNAIKNTPDNGNIYITLTDEDDTVFFAVENEGSHIEENTLDKVWDRFYKADKSRERSAGGTGLGLSIAKNILVLHKAEYGVENTVAGVKFWFRMKKQGLQNIL